MASPEDIARELAIMSLVRQGATREWAEAHVKNARLTEDGHLEYQTRLDRPMKRLYGEYTVDPPKTKP